jgi:hydrogenase-4 component F
MLLVAVLLIVPLLMFVLLAVGKNHPGKYYASVATAIAHLAGSVLLLSGVPLASFGGWLASDALAKIFLLILSHAYFWTVVNSRHFLSRPALDHLGGSKIIYYSLMNFYLFASTLAILANHFGLFWVAMEATTLSIAPLIYFYRTPEALEAMWKYLFAVSVGIAFAFIGFLFLSLAARSSSGGLFVSRLIEQSARLHPVWLKASFVFVFVGMSTKIGLAPMHPADVDAVSNAPSPVAALMSATLHGTALIGVLRMLQVVTSTPAAGFARWMCIAAGIFSLIVASLSIFRATNFKRLLAYSSVEHFGIIALGIGAGGVAAIGALLHLMYNSINKVALFLMAGNVHRRYETRDVDSVRMAIGTMRWTGWLFLFSFFAVAALPPFGLFFSELKIIQGLIESERWILLTVFLSFLLLVFIGMARIFFAMLYRAPGTTAASDATTERSERFDVTHATTLIMLAILVLLALALPEQILAAVTAIADSLA